MRVSDGKKRTTFFPIEMFGKYGEDLAQYITKGRQLLVEGRIAVSNRGRFNATMPVGDTTTPIQLKTTCHQHFAAEIDANPCGNPHSEANRYCRTIVLTTVLPHLRQVVPKGVYPRFSKYALDLYTKAHH